MSTTTLTDGPIRVDWTTTPAAPVPGRAVDLVAALAVHEPGSLTRWHAELAIALDELERSAGGTAADPDGRPRWTRADPVVVLLRALERLTRRSPTAASPSAGLLLRLLGSDQPSAS